MPSVKQDSSSRRQQQLANHGSKQRQGMQPLPPLPRRTAAAGPAGGRAAPSVVAAAVSEVSAAVEELHAQLEVRSEGSASSMVQFYCQCETFTIAATRQNMLLEMLHRTHNQARMRQIHLPCPARVIMYQIRLHIQLLRCAIVVLLSS
jgi:hypothetical protein